MEQIAFSLNEIINKVFCSDNIGLLKQIPDNTFDAIITSPPYDDMKEYKNNKSKCRAEWNGYSFDFEALARELFRVLKPGGIIFWDIKDKKDKGGFTGNEYRQALFFMKELGMLENARHFYIRSMAHGGKTRCPDPVEQCYIFSKGKPKTFNRLCNKMGRYTHKIGPSTNFHYCPNSGSAAKGVSQGTKDVFDHPAPFAEGLAHIAISIYTNEGDHILDPFSGSGTTSKAAVQMGRNYTAIDCVEEYCEMTRQRIQSDNPIIQAIPLPGLDGIKEPRNMKHWEVGNILRELFINQAANNADDVSVVEYNNATITITKLGNEVSSIAEELEDYISLSPHYLKNKQNELLSFDNLLRNGWYEYSMTIDNKGNPVYHIQVRVKDWIIEHCRHIVSGKLEHFTCEQSVFEEIRQEERMAA